MLTTRTWDEFKALVAAQTGGALNSITLNTLIQPLANLAAKRAYDASPYWPRFLIAGEPRTVSRGYIAFSEDSFYVYGAGSGAVNGLYQRNAVDLNGKARYDKNDDLGALIRIYWDGAAWKIEALDYITVNGERVTVDGDYVFLPGDVPYSNADTGSTPPLSGWTVVDGDSPAPLLVDVADIDTFLDVHIDGYPIAGEGGYSVDRLVSNKGCFIETGSQAPDIAYVTYKSVHSSIYGDGTGGTTSSIPSEWFDYMALYTSRQIQIGKRQGNESPYVVIAAREVEDCLEDELLKIELQGVSDNVGRKIETGIMNSNYL